ncbi:MAG: hypothetical protein DI563_05455 [Variovorax paradoxus]|uniref:Uncharacterized protein n=1 Tax=Variovorax paradoxus TaxID=34073 RepID=A0A2W5QIB5_VARPD|nr:MAG: hypothetical protein DI563_05455 [Variovorax paradoxus]
MSDQYLRGQHQRQVQAETAEWHHHETGTARFVQTRSGTVSAEDNPLAFLRAHGLVAVDADGDEVMPSPGQARGLVGEYLNGIQREGGRPSSSVSFRDPQMRGSAALVSARRIA